MYTISSPPFPLPTQNPVLYETLFPLEKISSPDM